MMEETAVAYATWFDSPAFPLKPGDKTPLVPKERGGHSDATTDERQIRD
ncbi:MAG TPA: hypothetical protein VGP82_14720 [Ktedonobacterales bacterium]|jgi:hypothetical protein|nr:hypothetical protein [Ktedonobacterales bacterium]